MRTLTFQRILGTGAFGSVYLAELAGDHGFRRTVAVKLLRQGHPNAAMFVTRMRDEARLMGLLRDEHILEVVELVRVEGRDAVVMEYVEGADLGDVLKAGFRPPPRALAELGAVVAGALGRAHRAVDPSTGQPLRVVHRDVKPANVMLTTRGGVKLLDFGVARAQFDARESRTGQFVLGTLNYMAPEYVLTGTVSSAADIYGLALVLWEAAVGEVYGQPKLTEDQHRARLNERLDRLPESHAPVEPLLREMLRWDPELRPDGEAVERALLDLADQLPGPGLRGWCAETVRATIDQRQIPSDDPSGFLGRSCRIEGPAGAEEVLARGEASPFEVVSLPTEDLRAGARPEARPTVPVARPEPTRPPSLAQAPTVVYFDDEPSPAAPSLPAPPRDPAPTAGSIALAPTPQPAPEPVPPPPPTPPRTGAPRPAAPSLARDVAKGLLIGGGFGLILVLIVLAVVLVVALP